MDLLDIRRDRAGAPSPTDRAIATFPQFAVTLGALTAAIALALVAIGLWRSDPLRLALLGTFATLGLFALFAVLAGHVRLFPRDEAATVPALVTEGLGDGVLVTDASGRVEFANQAFLDLAGANADRLDPLHRLVAGRLPAEEALFRLFRAAEQGAPGNEVVQVDTIDKEPGQSRWLRLSARLLRSPAATGDALPRQRLLWQLADISAEQESLRRQQAGLSETLAAYAGIPAAVFVSDSSGRISHMNDKLRARLDLDQTDAASGEIRIGDIMTSDSVAMLEAALAGATAGPARLDVTLLRGRRFGELATAIVERSATTGGLSAVLLDRSAGDTGQAAGPRDVDAATFFHSAPIGIATLSESGVITSANAALGRLLLMTRSPVQSPATLILARGGDPETRSAVETGIAAALAGEVRIAPVEITLGANREFTRRLFFAPLGAGPDETTGAMLYVIDATEQKALELKYAQSQRMDAVGKLVGGIAHDFNNVLTAIIGWSELLLGTLRPGDPGFKNISNIKSSAGRAAGLVNQLLAFSRQQTLQPEVLQLGEVLSEQSVLITRLLGEKIGLKINQDRELWYVKADRTQFTQVIMNLAVNARDAMPDGGKFQIKTRNITERESRRIDSQGFTVGEYVLIEVKDTGTGMPAEVKAKIFEPFFTTKGVGKGTGLGLSTVYGIVKQTGGYVFVDSEPGKGTTFRVYLPRHHVDEGYEANKAQKVAKDRTRDLTGTGRVLVVEDEDSVRGLTDEALRRQGYTVLQACNGREALDLMIENKFEVDLVVSDVIMPEMDGPTLLTELRKVKPHLKVILVSGYPDEAFKTNLDPDAQFTFLQKPYTLAQLAAKVKDELAR